MPPIRPYGSDHHRYAGEQAEDLTGHASAIDRARVRRPIWNEDYDRVVLDVVNRDLFEEGLGQALGGEGAAD